jgi:poly-gamma-glutamate synthesis protein (capsule biosynthesis protein)
MVYAHWGLEYSKTPGEDLKETAHALIDQGADLIIGSHPHVIQEKEIYRGKRIYYSLGNFIFDQYFRPATRRGLAVKVVIDAKDLALSFQEFHLIMDRSGQTKVENKLD